MSANALKRLKNGLKNAFWPFLRLKVPQNGRSDRVSQAGYTTQRTVDQPRLWGIIARSVNPLGSVQLSDPPTLL